MKYLSYYMNNKQSALFKETGAFFAFSNKQFEEAKVDGVVYNNLGAGMICPKDNVDKLITGIDNIAKESIAQDIADNGVNAIIRRELDNHECDYTGDYDGAIYALKGYGITEEQIHFIFNKGE